MMPTSSTPDDLSRKKLWKQPVPVWLWDVTQRRIVWANQACLDFSGASSVEDLRRLKFTKTLAFTKQLAALSAKELGPEGVRELIRFPAGEGEYIFDCRLLNRDIEPGQKGLLVELVADRGKTARVQKNKKSKKTAKKSGLSSRAANGAVQQEGPGIQVLDFEFGGQKNGVQVEPEKVDDDDLMTLQEIARLINGTNGPNPGLTGEPVPKQKEMQGQTKTVSTKQFAAAKSQKKNSQKTFGQAKKRVSKKDKKDGQKQTDTASPLQQGGEKNYFLESLPVALAIAFGGRLMLANEAFLYAFGYGSKTELREAGGLPVLFPESQNGVMRAPEAGSGRKSSRSGQVQMLAISRSGRKRQIPVAFRNVSTGREPVQILILHEEALDSSKQCSAVNAARVTEGEASFRASVSQDSIDFLATVSHEVRTPLNSIIGFSELMKDERFGPVDPIKFRGYAQDIHESAMHALSLINDLLDITKIIAGKPDLDFEAVNVGQSVEKVVQLMRSQAEQRKIIVQTSLARNLPALFADTRALKQILLNLVSNAIKFTPADGRVTLSVEGSSKTGVWLKISDTGIGMRPDQLGTALEPFAQVEPSRNLHGANRGGSEKGTGLGLPLAKALVKAHFARFSIDSRPGQGTTIEIFFPPERLADRA